MATMQLDVTFRNIDSSEALKSYAREKVERVKKYVDRPMEAHVVLSTERHEMHADIQINVHQANLVLRGKSVHDDMYAALDLAIDKIERQVRKYKDKLKSHKPSANGVPLKVRYGVLAPEGLMPEGDLAYEATTPLPPAEQPPSEPAGPRIVKSNEFLAKPMSLDEAVMQMDLMNNEFLVFRNAQSEEVNIIYRRKDGNIGLIEATGS
jgi:putative sigma-54 modulation protein